MDNLRTPDINVSHAKQVMGQCMFIDNDLLLFGSFDEVPLSTDPRRVNCLFVAICLEGCAKYTVDGKEQLVKKDDVILINDGQVIDSYLLSHDCRGVAMMCSNDFFSEVLKEVREISNLFLFAYSHPVFHLMPERVQTFMEYYNLILQKIKDPEHQFRRELAMSLLKAMLYDMGNEIHRRLLSAPKRTCAETIFHDFIVLVKEHFRQERRVGWYAEQLCITPKYLSETVKQVSRRTPNDWIDHYVILEIRLLLRCSNMSIKEIAQDLNFPNQSFFGKYFKEHVGTSPSKYRRY